MQATVLRSIVLYCIAMVLTMMCKFTVWWNGVVERPARRTQRRRGSFFDVAPPLTNHDLEWIGI